MTFAASLHALSETAAPARAGERVAARLGDVRDLVARELEQVEALVAARIDGGVAPAADSARHLFDAGGKRIRPLSLLLAAACFGPLGEEARELAAASELVHMATLLHDDVIDDGDQRRGRPTSRKVWGNAVSVLAGDRLLVEALAIASRAHPATWAELVTTLGRLVDGEVVQLRGRHAVSLDEDTYFAIVRGKTASLFEWALRAGARAGDPRGPGATGGAGPSPEAVDALGAFGARLGVAFQLVDDVLDVDGDPRATGKAMLADLAEGKVTLPVLRAAAADPAIGRLIEAARAGDAPAAREIAERVRASGSCERVRELARAETRLALSALDAVPACRARDVLAEVARGLASRIA